MERTFLFHVWLCGVTIILQHVAFSQASKNFYLQDPGGDKFKCMRCKTVLDKLPHEVEMGTIVSKNNEVLFYLTNTDWLPKLFKNKGDGIAIDLITKDQYACGQKNKLRTTGFHDGTLLPPVFLKDFAQQSKITNGIFYLKIADLPPEFRDQEVEANYMILQDNYVCHYESTFNIQAYGWDLLDMGMYADSIVYSHTIQKTKTDSLYSKPVIFDKRMKFIIPFEKNKFDYKNDDFKPIYDSLNLTDYLIQAITIKAYSSVEGSEEKNIELQKKRGQSIANALQSYQQPHINTAIYAAENWVEFYYDVSNSSTYNYLTPYSKEEVKQKLFAEKKLKDDMEVFFKNHRKAILVIELNHKNKISELKEEELVSIFDEALQQKNIDRALEIQRTVFRRINNDELPATFLSKLTVPKKIEYHQLLMNQAAFNYLRNPDNYAAYLEFQELEDLLPKDGRIKYNLCVLMFKLLRDGEYVVSTEELRSSISQLESFSIPKPLIDRMMINYNIIMCESYMQKGDYDNKDKCLKYIQLNYQNFPMTDLDLVCLAQYMSRYTMYDWAAKLLEPQVSRVDVEEDLLFYYINLALGQPINEEFKITLLNALNADKDRYCGMFNSVRNGGASFQLLSDKVLKKTYCENCAK